MPSPPAPIPELPPQALRQRIDAGEVLTLLDVREPRERAFCSIAAPATAGDLHIPMRQIPVASRGASGRRRPRSAGRSTAITASARWPSRSGSPSGSRERSSICKGASTPGRSRWIRRSGATDGFEGAAGITGLVRGRLGCVLALGEVPEPDLSSFLSQVEDEQNHPGLLTAVLGDRAGLDDLLGEVIAADARLRTADLLGARGHREHSPGPELN